LTEIRRFSRLLICETLENSSLGSTTNKVDEEESKSRKHQVKNVRLKEITKPSLIIIIIELKPGKILFQSFEKHIFELLTARALLIFIKSGWVGCCENFGRIQCNVHHSFVKLINKTDIRVQSIC
jgi:hypothetical protein